MTSPDEGGRDGRRHIFGQGELSVIRCHHAFVANSILTTREADAPHQDHSTVEQLIAELEDELLVRLPSPTYFAYNGPVCV